LAGYLENNERIKGGVMLTVETVNKIDRFLDIVQAHLIIAGGCKIPIDELKDMSFIDILELIIANKINLRITFEGHE